MDLAKYLDKRVEITDKDGKQFIADVYDITFDYDNETEEDEISVRVVGDPPYRIFGVLTGDFDLGESDIKRIKVIQ